MIRLRRMMSSTRTLRTVSRRSGGNLPDDEGRGGERWRQHRNQAVEMIVVVLEAVCVSVSRAYSEINYVHGSDTIHKRGGDVCISESSEECEVTNYTPRTALVLDPSRLGYRSRLLQRATQDSVRLWLMLCLAAQETCNQTRRVRRGVSTSRLRDNDLPM